MQVKIQPSLRMGTFLLLLFLITSEEAHADFIIKNVELLIDPSSEVQRGTNVTLTCRAEISYSQGSHPNYTYIFYKDYNKPLKTSATDHLYLITDSRVGHSGRYRCAVVIEKQNKESSIKDLTVKGLQTPVLTVDKIRLTEGDDLTATCSAEGEIGSLTFFFKNASEELYSEATREHRIEQKLSLPGGTGNLFCQYSINLGSTIAFSDNSNLIKVNIQELEIKPVITVHPSTDVIEGDTISFSCTVDMLQQQNSELRIILVRGPTTLTNMTKNEYSMHAKANDSGEYECISQMGVIHKSSTVNITVQELFSVPVLSISPAQVFEGEYFIVTCQVNSFASERIQRDEIKYSIFRDDALLIREGSYSVTASKETNGKYTCKAEANVISKKSWSLVFEAKVFVSKPKITVDGPVIVGKPFRIYCHSDNGSLPIFYNLKRNHFNLNWTKVSSHHDEASFLATVSTPAEISSYWCEAKNNGPPKMSERLNASVIVPVGKPLLTVLPVPGNIKEGDNITLICGIPKGSPPISFRFYNSSNSHLHTATVTSNLSAYILTEVNRQHSGTYYCEAFNQAEETSQSDPITFKVGLAMWKKALIATFSMLLVALLVLFFMMRYKAKQVRVKDKESVWSERPLDVADQEIAGSPNEGDVEYTEVVHPQHLDPARILLRKGTDTVYSELQTSQGAAEHLNHVLATWLSNDRLLSNRTPRFFKWCSLQSKWADVRRPTRRSYRSNEEELQIQRGGATDHIQRRSYTSRGEELHVSFTSMDIEAPHIFVHASSKSDHT
ncbi:platelet endothelial cell adhesion molecule isoform X2 [Triplophysa rosa]|uniref:platelet endothelial cell adhesion molecule isoform X2 n=1 Tax=Triplophysa rosa TaxID=992332 RepID=UPI002545C3E2|nr:platelet endothelial cell adhesion molecule isoform X2 [Triplophysa rosa]